MATGKVLNVLTNEGVSELDQIQKFAAIPVACFDVFYENCCLGLASAGASCFTSSAG
jgi:hypothetical protein